MNKNAALTAGSIPAPANGYSVPDIDSYAATLRQVTEPIEGTYRGTIVAADALSGLPPVLRRALTHAIGATSAPVWRGKSFTQRTGTNLWLGRRHQKAFGGFTQDINNGVLILDYNIDDNPRAVRPIRGDLWELGAGTYVGRMRYETNANSRTLIYFTLER
ncbi:MAG: hypothetical protein CMJ44_13940 [Pimelobacter sp.]|nr:hypothetical protein [Pimelobacter sp.]